MTEIISYERALEISHCETRFDMSKEPIYVDASVNDRCQFILTIMPSSGNSWINVFIKSDRFFKGEIYDTMYKDYHDTTIGYEIEIRDDGIYAYTVKTHYMSQFSNGALIYIFDKNTSLNEIIKRCDAEIDICTCCRKPVPFEEQQNRSVYRYCDDCATIMKDDSEFFFIQKHSDELYPNRKRRQVNFENWVKNLRKKYPRNW